MQEQLKKIGGARKKYITTDVVLLKEFSSVEKIKDDIYNGRERDRPKFD